MKNWSANPIDVFHEILGYEIEEELAAELISDFIAKHSTEETFRKWMTKAAEQLHDSRGG